jgi:hypothetical protein
MKMMMAGHTTTFHRNTDLNLYSAEVENDLYRFDRLREAEYWRLGSQARAAQGSGYRSESLSLMAVVKAAAGRVTEAASSAARVVRAWYSGPEAQCC